DEPATNEQQAPAAETPAGLAAAAEAEPHPDVKKLFQNLADVYDVLREKSGSPTRVQPIPKYVGKRVTEPFTVRPLSNPKLPIKVTALSLAEDNPVEHYEDRAVAEVDNFLRLALDKRLPTAPGYLARDRQLAVGERVLVAVINWHAAARERNQ